MITLAIETSCDETAVCILETRQTTNDEPTATGKPNHPQPTLEYRILANLIHSQIALHRQYGGVFPIMAKREHAKNLIPLIEAALAQAHIQLIKIPPADAREKVNEIGKIDKIKKILQEKESDLLKHLLVSSLVEKNPAGSIDRIAVTRGPGLEPALWVGVNAARSLGILWDIPVVGVNHMEGHVVGSLLPSSEVWDSIAGSATVSTGLASDFKKLISITCPALALLISGGHTELVLVKDGGDKKNHTHNTDYEYEIVGRTKDDAVGEAFDKVARLLGLPYPGGPEINKLASAERRAVRNEKWKAEQEKNNEIILPRPMIHSPDLDFSFSGLKTAVLYMTRELRKKNVGAGSGADNGDGAEKSSVTGELTAQQKSRIAREFEDAVTDVLIAKTEKAIEQYGVVSLIVGGGVIANSHIAQALTGLAKQHDIPIYMPPAGVSGDNALMIALAGALSTASEEAFDATSDILQADGNLSFGV
jgi:N6-L-threonylcarbamoyladenine synthase